MEKFYNFKEIDEEVELRIEGEIVSDDDVWISEAFGVENTSPNKFKEELSKYKNKDITVWIDSFGGDVFAGAGIYNALKEHKGKVTVKIDGKAISSASVIAMAGDTVEMSPVAIMMIHNPMSFAVGDYREMQKTAEILNEVKETIINAYQIKTGKQRAKISQMMDNETWMGSRAALSEGFIDEVMYSDKSFQDNFNYSKLCVQNSVGEQLNKFYDKYKNELEEKEEVPTDVEIEEAITNENGAETQPVSDTITEEEVTEEVTKEEVSEVSEIQNNYFKKLKIKTGGSKNV